jgi:hypothetical protein
MQGTYEKFSILTLRVNEQRTKVYCSEMYAVAKDTQLLIIFIM